MKYAGTRAAQARYDNLTEPDARGEVKALATDGAAVHVLLPAVTSAILPALWQRLDGIEKKHPLFLEHWEYQRAACGRNMKVVLPFAFDDAEPTACSTCKREAAAWRADPEAWWKERHRREAEMRARHYEQEDVEEWQAKQRPVRFTIGDRVL